MIVLVLVVVVVAVVLKMPERRSKDLYVQILHNTMLLTN